uniref:Conotoxin n=1 Tax=Conus andremenezi TaxID=1077466 RepID=A0A291C1T4_9COND|nr:conotoxin [Conus andremenezi]
MMSKLGVLLTICLLLFPLTVLPLDGVQGRHHLTVHPLRRLTARGSWNGSRKCCQAACGPYLCLPCCPRPALLLRPQQVSNE